jgi:NAD(P)-dependent dehydrogenase (short-subunit alcohol dehydrogenase family)
MTKANKVYFISGANRGIGRALVEAALAAGATKVYAAARNTNTLPKWNDLRVVPVKLDITDTQLVEAAARMAHDTDTLINNSGILTAGSVLSGSEHDLRRDMDTNFFGTLKMVRAFAPVIEKNGGGAIANLLSVVSLASMSALAGYSASKAALFSTTQALRTELKGRGIAVHGIFPGPIDTDMAKGINFPKTSPQATAKAIILGIISGSEDIFPDEMSRQAGANWAKDPKSIERAFASM